MQFQKLYESVGWGGGRLVGLKADVHLLAFVLDPFVHGALTSAHAPTCDLLDGTVIEAARAALRHFSKDDAAVRAVLLQQFMPWNAAAPQLRISDGAGGSNDAQPVAQASGNNAFSFLRLDAMQHVWNKVSARNVKLECDSTPRDEDSSAWLMRETLAKLRLTSSPVEFWLAMMNEVPRGASPEHKEAHLLFCKTAADISGIVGHTCGVERAGKAYKQVLSSLRKSMDETRAMKAICIYSNYNLRDHKQSARDAFSAFTSPDAVGQQDQAENEKDPYAKYARGVKEVRWSVPDGFKVADEPSVLNASLVGSSVVSIGGRRRQTRAPCRDGGGADGRAPMRRRPP